MKKILYTILLFSFCFTLVYGGDDSNSKRPRTPAKTTAAWAKRIKQTAGEFSVWLSNQMVMGVQAWDGDVPADNCGPTGLGAVYPASACIEHLYGAGPWIGAIQDGVRKVSEGYNGSQGTSYFEPSQKDTARDRIWTTSASDTGYNPNREGYYKKGMGNRNIDDDGDGRLNEDELDGFDNDGDWVLANDDIGKDGLLDVEETGCKGGYDPVTNPDPGYDNWEPSKKDSCKPDPVTNALPFKRSRDHYTQGNGIPDHGEPHVDEDFAAFSDNDIYMSATDTASHLPTSHQPLKMKVFQKSYAWNRPDLNGIIPFEYYFVNVGKKASDSLNDVYVGFFADMDVHGPSGSPQRNYAAYFDSLRTAYIHNPVEQGATPLGLVVLETPIALESLKYTFQWHEFEAPCGTINDEDLYSCMSCEAFGNTNCIKGNQSENSLNDTRFIFSFGPFKTIKPGDTLKIAVALIVGDGITSGTRNLKEQAEKAIKLWGRNYRTPKIPPSPCLNTDVGFKKITLTWGGGGMTPVGDGKYRCVPEKLPYETWDDSSKIVQALPDTHWRKKNPPEGHEKGGRIFEGYRLYRSESTDMTDYKSYTLIKQFDMPGDEYEYNVGLDTFFVDTNLVRGKVYNYAVTSFGIPDLTVIARPLASGGVLYDSLYSENTESDLLENAIQVKLPFSISEELGEVLAVPNPYRVDENYTRQQGGFEGENYNWDENARKIKFIHLPRKCTIRVFTIAGDLVTTLEHDAGTSDVGEIDWNIQSESHRALASGIYVFTVESEYGRQVGKFVLIR
ncbi:MAG: hypothetical protein HY960_06090 [Ignavibacteriae bacterium]|nr:hypothetical protein [Ignavibacteriota bacterium]